MSPIGYKSPFNYSLDPLIQLSPFQGDLKPRKPNNYPYSSHNKSYYAPVPYNTQPMGYEPSLGSFDITRLPQSDVLEVIARNSLQVNFGKVSLAKVIEPLICKIGTIQTLMEDNIGTCTLISHDLVIVARHAIADIDIQNLKVKFGFVKQNRSFDQTVETQFEYILEEDSKLDYAIVKLKEPLGKNLGYVELNTKEEVLSETALLHYPLGKPLKVSVHTSDQPDLQSHFLNTFHDSDYFSSGGAYIDVSGKLTAIHLGAQVDGDKMNFCRYAVTLKEITNSRPTSILAKFAKGEWLQYKSSFSSSPLFYLDSYETSFLMEQEGIKSKKILTEIFKRQIDKSNKKHFDKNIKHTKSGIAFSKANLTYIESNYQKKFKKFISQCSYISGIHKDTKKFSVSGIIESDHLIPYDVYKKTKNEKVKKLLVGKGKRPGENLLATITIPYQMHRKLRTTGSSNKSKNFRATLVELADRNRFDKVIRKCFQEYKKVGVNLKKHKFELIKLLKEHKKLKLINSTQKDALISKFFNEEPKDNP